MKPEALLGQAAPDFALKDQHGQTIQLADYAGQKNLILFFVRTYACYACREHVRQLARLYERIQAQDGEVLVILNGDEIAVQGYADICDTPFPVLADPNHRIYEQFGLDKVFLFSTRTASVVVDKSGTVRYIRSAVNPWGWRTESQDLIAHLEDKQSPAA